jgi:hypothetical protein
MMLIQLTGNFAFFNLLGVALSLLLLDDRVWLHGYRLLDQRHVVDALPVSPGSITLAPAVAALILILSIDTVARLFRGEIQWPRPLARLLDLLEPFHLVNSYGLFAIMTTWRQEIVVEGSLDGQSWQAYEFKYKPGDPSRPPRFVAPHQPRLDWQMWFAALGVNVSNAWFERLLERLKQGAPEVLALLEKNPFADRPPRFIRAIRYDYRFSTRAEMQAGGAWWHRERRGLFKS